MLEKVTYSDRLLEHEIDHLNGILHIDRIDGDHKLYQVKKQEEYD
jgi:peptide deformylase